ncbi:OprO/OprP family phosphate-selective porin [Rufibacter roseus]|uniref:OprO/OprP family phosphate-selective porin n=1 Tax=Rufibacter roseus TaxID=1567108 RepID=A0ABW2DK24_9BACT|nr:porin [Rufibacter roseus]
MRRVLLLLCCTFMFAQAMGQSSPLEAYWQDGLKFRSKDTLYRFSVGGRLHYDLAYSGQSEELGSRFEHKRTQVEVRRARISLEGNIRKELAYEFEVTFGEDIEFADMYVAFLQVPLVERLTVGHFREPFGLEELTSSNAIVFMERALTSTFGPDRNTGIMVQKPFWQERLRGYVGVFRITDDLGNDRQGLGDHSFTTRWAFAPVVADHNQVLHLGLAFNRIAPDTGNYRISTNNEVNTSPDYLDTGVLKGVENVNQLGTELGFTRGRWLLQGEWIQSFTKFSNQAPDGLANAKHRYQSFYLLTSFFLKGGARVYSKGSNRFNPVLQPRHPGQDDFGGAWEAGLRYSYLDLRDSRQPLHTLHNVTAGLTWYYNTNTRVMMNYVHSLFNQGARANTLQGRLQFTF